MKHNNKVVVITGAGQGMGRAMVELFAREGARVAALDINAEAAGKVARELGDSVIGIGCDVSSSQSVKSALEEVEGRFGRLDVVINNAGTGAIDEFLATPDENWQRVIGVNLTGAFYCAREGARLMQKGGAGGVIINVSSSSALSGEGPSHYCASKAGIIGLTRSIARELAGSGIRVNTLMPGATDTPMLAGISDEWRDHMISGIPLGRLCEPEEVARVASFLASDDSSFVTGQSIAVNGGMVFV